MEKGGSARKKTPVINDGEIIVFTRDYTLYNYMFNGGKLISQGETMVYLGRGVFLHSTGTFKNLMIRSLLEDGIVKIVPSKTLNGDKE